MKKKTSKKLTLNKIKIASLQRREQAKINGGAVLPTIIIIDPTRATRCFICPAITRDCID